MSVAPAPRATRRALPPAQQADPRLEVGDPPSPDAAARRDGIRDPSPRGASAPRGSLSPRARSARSDPATGSHKAAWLTQLVAATPLTAWPAHLGLPAAAIAALVVGPAPASPGRAASARSAFLEGLEQAAARQRDAEWAEALLRVRPGAVGLLGVLPAARAHALVAAQAATARPPALQGQLGALPGPWPRGLSLAVVGRFAALGAGLSLSPGMLALLSIRLDPGVDAAVLEWAGALPRRRPPAPRRPRPAPRADPASRDRRGARGGPRVTTDGLLRAFAEQLYAAELAALAARTTGRGRRAGGSRRGRSRPTSWAARCRTARSSRRSTSGRAGSSRSPSRRWPPTAPCCCSACPAPPRPGWREHLAAAVSGDSTLLVQGTAGTGRGGDPLRLELRPAARRGPVARRARAQPGACARWQTGTIARVEELTRIPADVQDALITILSEKTLPIPELGHRGAGACRAST